MDKQTIKEHYVPQFYLKQFSDINGLLHIYDFKQKKIYTQKPKNVCYEKNLYETEWMDANPKLGKFVLPNDIEKTYCKYEREFSAVLNKIIQCVPSPYPSALILHGKEKEVFFRFIVNLILRNPRNMNSLNLGEIEPDDINNIEMIKLRNLLDDIGFGGANSVYLAAKKKIMLTEEMEDNFPKICYEDLKKLNYSFFYAQDYEFITSDVPVCVGDDSIITEENKTCIYLALSPRVAVVFGNYKNSKKFRNRMTIINRKIVEKFNMVLSKHNDEKQLLIGNSDKLIKKYISDKE